MSQSWISATAVALLDEVLRAARPGDDRISADPVRRGRLAGVCGGLPLALRIAGALLTADPVLTAAELADELRDEVGRLEALRYDDGGGTSAPSVAAAFELSYRQLDADGGVAVPAAAGQSRPGCLHGGDRGAGWLAAW